MRVLLFWSLVAASVGLPLLLAGRHASGDPKSILYYLTYVAPMICFASLLLSSRFYGSRQLRPRDIGLDLTAIGVAASRMIAPVIPFSGHMVLLIYAFLSSRRRMFRFVALGLAAHTTYLKLVVWGDVLTWSVGVAGGVALASLRTEPWWATARSRGE